MHFVMGVPAAVLLTDLQEKLLLKCSLQLCKMCIAVEMGREPAHRRGPSKINTLVHTCCYIKEQAACDTENTSYMMAARAGLAMQGMGLINANGTLPQYPYVTHNFAAILLIRLAKVKSMMHSSTLHRTSTA